MKFKLSEGIVFGSIFSVAFWFMFLSLLKYHINNASLSTTYTLTIMVAINFLSITFLFDSWSKK